MTNDNKLYQKAYDEIRAKAQNMVGSQASYRALDAHAKRDLRDASKKLLNMSEADNAYKRWQDSHSKYNKGFIYLITNKAWPGWIKVGRASNIKSRLVVYQTGSPLRDYEVIRKAECNNTLKAELDVLSAIRQLASESNGEWSKIPKLTAKRTFNKIMRVN